MTSNLLSNCLIGLYKLLPSHSPLCSKFSSIIYRVNSSWTPTKSLFPKQMKLFYGLNLYHEIASLFKSIPTTSLFIWPTTPHTFPLSLFEAVTMLLDSCHNFFKFAYTQLPSSVNFDIICVSRNCVLTCHHQWNWLQAPTTHYATTHAIEDAKIDGTAYITLQEGVEAANHDDKEEFRIAFKVGISFEGGETIFQHLIN